jgi:hypothetical protein
MHPCSVDGCEHEGSWGFKVKLLKGEPGVWYCYQHRHLGEALYRPLTSGAQDVVVKETADEHPPTSDSPDAAERPIPAPRPIPPRST